MTQVPLTIIHVITHRRSHRHQCSRNISSFNQNTALPSRRLSHFRVFSDIFYVDQLPCSSPSSSSSYFVIARCSSASPAWPAATCARVAQACQDSQVCKVQGMRIPIQGRGKAIILFNESTETSVFYELIFYGLVIH